MFIYDCIEFYIIEHSYLRGFAHAAGPGPRLGLGLELGWAIWWGSILSHHGAILVGFCTHADVDN